MYALIWVILGFCVTISCLANKVDASKKACVWQQCRLSRWWLPNSCLCVASPGRWTRSQLSRNEAVRAADFVGRRRLCRPKADRVPRSLFYAITNLSRLTGEAGRHLIKPSELAFRLIFFVSCRNL